MTDRIIATNPTGPDVEHPIDLRRIQLVDVEEKSKVFAHHPQLKYVLSPLRCLGE